MILSICLGIGLGLLLNMSVKPENDAEATVCRDMARNVLAGEASRFDYMATRCSAQFLVPAEDA